YHSLIIPPDGVPPALEVAATTPEGEVMALRHASFPVWGVQFHPESVLTEHGYTPLRRVLALEPGAAAAAARGRRPSTAGLPRRQRQVRRRAPRVHRRRHRPVRQQRARYG